MTIAATTDGTPLLRMRGVSKRFGAVQALAGITGAVLLAAVVLDAVARKRRAQTGRA